MLIAIIGAGNIGTTLATGWVGAGHTVVFGAKNADSPKVQAALAAVPSAKVLSVNEAAQTAEVIVIATPAQAVLEIASNLGNVSGKVIIDTTNAVRVKPEPYKTASEALKALTNSPHIVKCFNSTGFENIQNPHYDGVTLDMFVAGDSAHGKQIAIILAKDIGFAECYDFGGDDKVELLEHFAAAWINLAIMQKHGRTIGFKLLRR